MVTVAGLAQARPRWQELFVEGQAEYAAGRYGAAAERFLEAHALRAAAALLHDAAVARGKQGDACAALGLFERYLDERPDAGDADAVAERIDALDRACAGASR